MRSGQGGSAAHGALDAFLTRITLRTFRCRRKCGRLMKAYVIGGGKAQKAAPSRANDAGSGRGTGLSAITEIMSP